MERREEIIMPYPCATDRIGRHNSINYAYPFAPPDRIASMVVKIIRFLSSFPGDSIRETRGRCFSNRAATYAAAAAASWS